MFFTTLAMGVAYGIPGDRLSELVVQGFSNVLDYIAIVIVSANVTGFGEMDVAEGYRTITLMSVILEVLALAVIAVAGPFIV